jgi:hypothetical protein
MTMKHRRLRIFAGAMTLASAACGRDVALESRPTLAADAIKQSYDITVFASAAGVDSYFVTAKLVTSDGMRDSATTLPSGDTLTLNGTALVAGQDHTYGAEGRVLPTSFTFAWTHLGVTYTNAFSVGLYPPASVPETLVKSAPSAIELPAVPAGVTVSATVNAGSSLAAPYFAWPVRVSGDGTAASVTPTLAELAEGAAVMTLSETQTQAVTSGTAAGGHLKALVQYGYYVTIGP